MAAQDATEDEEAADEDLGDDVIPEDDDEAEVEDDENTELVRSCLVVFFGFVLFVFHALVACIYGHLKSVVSNDQIPPSCLCLTTLSFFDKALKHSTFSAI